MQSPDRALALPPSDIASLDDDSVRTVPVWASPPDVEILAMLGSTPSVATGALRIIRHRLELRRAQGMWTFAVTSARDGEGKSTLAAQLALVLSEARRARVLLVEAAMDRPAQSRLFGFHVPSGLGFSAQISRRMQGGSEPWSVLAIGPCLHALVESAWEEGFPGALHAPEFRQAIDRLGRAYDWVVVDAPSVLGSGDANVVEEVVDGVVVAVRSRRSRKGDLRAAMKQLGSRKAVGAVLWGAGAGVEVG